MLIRISKKTVFDSKKPNKYKQKHINLTQNG